MSDTEQPPPYALYQGLDSSKAFIVTTRRYTLRLPNPQGKASWGRYLGQNNDAIIIAPNMTLAHLLTRLNEGAARYFDVENEPSGWYETLLVTLDDQVIDVYHEDTWLACRKLLLTREGGVLTYDFAIRDGTIRSQVPTQEHTSDNTPAKSQSGCRFLLRNVATRFGRLLIRAGTSIRSAPRQAG
ncbi:hypothetical protein LTR17_006353 [Elasticomyces elasticus]|nr:hypothetical protein LTR17_006353 [Elasticomyces elasticus]